MNSTKLITSTILFSNNKKLVPEFVKSLIHDRSFKILDDLIINLVVEDIVLDAKIDLFILTKDYVYKLPQRVKALELLKQQLSDNQKEILYRYLK